MPTMAFHPEKRSAERGVRGFAPGTDAFIAAHLFGACCFRL
jgi:hypothetical protein